MQVGEPVENLIDDAYAGVRIGRRLEPVRKLVERLRDAEIRAAQREHQDHRQRPEAEHAVQVPGEALPSGVPVNSQASSPRPDPRPPHDDARASEDDNQERTHAVDRAPRCASEQVVV